MSFFCNLPTHLPEEPKIIEQNQIPKGIQEKLGDTNGQFVGTILKDIIVQSKDKDHIAISQEYGDLMRNMITFNITNIYRSKESKRYLKQTEKMLNLLFDDLMENINDIRNSPENTPPVYRVFKEYLSDMDKIYEQAEPDELKVLDFIAGMTDMFAVRSFQELFEPRATV